MAHPAGNWLRGPIYDGILIFGVLALALAWGFGAEHNPRLFPVLLAADLWLLGYHHVMATYTRLCFDAESFQRYRKLVLHLPLAVFGCTAAAGLLGGAILLSTVYLHWQWYHYTRQSEGIARAYAARGGRRDLMTEPITRLVFWLMPVTAFCNLCVRQPSHFLGMPVAVLPVPFIVVEVLNVFAACMLTAWVVQQLVRALRGRLPLPWLAYVLSHFVVYYVAYIQISEINHGWLAINVWHNAQYIAFVWLFNTNRFRDGITPRHRFLSTLSQPDRLPLYLAVCLGLSSLMYLGVGLAADWFRANALFLAVAVYQAVNFHHYIVDSLIWKLRKPEVGKPLGLASGQV